VQYSEYVEKLVSLWYVIAVFDLKYTISFFYSTTPKITASKIGVPYKLLPEDISQEYFTRATYSVGSVNPFFYVIVAIGVRHWQKCRRVNKEPPDPLPDALTIMLLQPLLFAWTKGVSLV